MRASQIAQPPGSPAEPERIVTAVDAVPPDGTRKRVELLVKDLHHKVNHSENRRAYFRWWALRIKAFTIVGSVLTTILVGIHLNKDVDPNVSVWVTNLTLIVSALVGGLVTWEAFRNDMRLWIHFAMIRNKLESLLTKIKDWQLSADPRRADCQKTLQQFMVEYEAILSNAFSVWAEVYSTMPRDHKNAQIVMDEQQRGHNLPD
jgi:hypothetical protein